MSWLLPFALLLVFAATWVWLWARAIDWLVGRLWRRLEATAEFQAWLRGGEAAVLDELDGGVDTGEGLRRVKARARRRAGQNGVGGC